MKFLSVSIEIPSYPQASNDQFLDLKGKLDIGYVTIKHESGRQALVDTQTYMLDLEARSVVCPMSNELEESTLLSGDLDDLNKLSFEVFAAFDDSASSDFHYGDAKLLLSDDAGEEKLISVKVED